MGWIGGIPWKPVRAPIYSFKIRGLKDFLWVSGSIQKYLGDLRPELERCARRLHHMFRKTFVFGGAGGRVWKAHSMATTAMREDRAGYYNNPPRGGTQRRLVWTGSLQRSFTAKVSTRGVKKVRGKKAKGKPEPKQRKARPGWYGQRAAAAGPKREAPERPPPIPRGGSIKRIRYGCLELWIGSRHPLALVHHEGAHIHRPRVKAIRGGGLTLYLRQQAPPGQTGGYSTVLRRAKRKGRGSIGWGLIVRGEAGPAYIRIPRRPLYDDDEVERYGILEMREAIVQKLEKLWAS